MPRRDLVDSYISCFNCMLVIYSKKLVSGLYLTSTSNTVPRFIERQIRTTVHDPRAFLSIWSGVNFWLVFKKKFSGFAFKLRQFVNITDKWNWEKLRILETNQIDSIARVHKLSKRTESVHASLDLPETSYMNGQQLWSLMKELLEIFLGKLVRRSPTLHRICHWRIKMYGRIKKKASRSELHCFYFPLRHLLEQKVDWSASPSSMRPL